MSMTKRQEAEKFLQYAFDSTLREHQANSHSPFPQAYINESIAVIERSGAGQLLAQWRLEDGIEPRGRKAYVPMEAALVIMLMHLREGRGLLFSEMSATLAYRLTDAQLRRIGIEPRPLSQEDWYNNLIRSVDRLVALIDAYPGPRRSLLKGGAYIKVLESRDPEECEKKRARASLLANQIVRGSVELLHRDLFTRWTGNIAFDATFFALSGKEGNPKSSADSADRRSINYDGGWYKRGGDHDGDAAPRREKLMWGLELETMMMTANVPGQAADFPLLNLVIDFHKPGKIKLAGQRMLKEMGRRKYPVGHAMCDQAYMPGAMADELQGPFLDAGYRAVFDYGIQDHGQQASFKNAILVMGAWYVMGMPATLVQAEMLHTKAVAAIRKKGSVLAGLKAVTTSAEAKTKILIDTELRALANAAKKEGVAEQAAADALLADRVRQRAPYRLKRKGRRRPDGSQQYFYPDPDTYMIVNPDTGELAPRMTTPTVLIPRDAGLKHAQHYLHGDAEWQSWYSLRNTVEGSYAHVKDVLHEDFGAAAKRRKRGNTFAFLAAALSMASANIRKILSWISSHASDVILTSKNRKSFGLDREMLAEQALLAGAPEATLTVYPPPLE